MEKRITKSADETKLLGKEFASTLIGGEVIALFGDLGSGKTTFVQGVAQGLGITQRVVSPTFLILKTYRLRKKRHDIEIFYHVDLYRTETSSDIDSLGLLELLHAKDTVIIIEWPEKLGSALSEKIKKVHFSYISETERSIRYE